MQQSQLQFLIVIFILHFLYIYSFYFFVMCGNL